MSFIEIRDFTKKIKGNVILGNINLILEEGKVYGFVGINGSGKTMLFKGIAGLINPTNGEILVNSIKVGNGVSPHNTSILIENSDLWENLSAFDNLRFLNYLSKDKIRDSEIIKTISDFGLNPEDKKPYKKFSLGMKQKLRIAQAFMGNPKLIILDEPTNALDEKSILKLRTSIIDAKKRGSTILIASHSKIDIDILCDEIIFMDSGKILKIEKTREI